MLAPSEIRNLVFSGGGVRGYSYIGVLQELVDNGVILSTLDGVGGTSIGALMATLIASGWSPNDMEKELLTVHVRQLVDLSLNTLWYDYGLDSGKVIQEYIGSLISRYCCDDPQITFIELFRCTKIRLVLVATDLNENTEIMFSHDTTPHDSVSYACMMSLALPGLFAPQRYHGKLIVDGGVKNNFPLKYFPDVGTLGVRVEWGYAKRLDSIDQVLARATYCILTENEEVQWNKLSENHKRNTVTVKVGDLTTINLYLTSEHKRLILRRGRLAIRHTFTRRLETTRYLAACIFLNLAIYIIMNQ
jgi:predicted acylesterase/phospholipase RssA